MLAAVGKLGGRGRPRTFALELFSHMFLIVFNFQNVGNRLTSKVGIFLCVCVYVCVLC